MQTVDGNLAADALRQSEARTHAILATAVDAVVVIGAAGTIETFNPGAERMFGYAAPEVIGRNVRMLMPEPYRGAARWLPGPLLDNRGKEDHWHWA
jgi:PAS domain S-box-containing protein